MDNDVAMKEVHIIKIIENIESRGETEEQLEKVSGKKMMFKALAGRWNSEPSLAHLMSGLQVTACVCLF